MEINDLRSLVEFRYNDPAHKGNFQLHGFAINPLEFQSVKIDVFERTDL